MKLLQMINKYFMKINFLKIASILILSLVMILFVGCGSDDGNLKGESISLNNNLNKKDMASNFGTIKIQLYKEKAPITVENFIQLAEEGKYDDVPMHRIIDDFMIQGGDFTNKNGTGGHAARYHEGLGILGNEETWLIPDEFHDDLKHEYGSVSMANAGPNTGGSQFFIVNKKEGTPWLDGKHSVFGKVIEGMDVVEEISKVETDSYDIPIEPVIIKKVDIEQSDGSSIAVIEI